MNNYARKLALLLLIALSTPAFADGTYTYVYDAYRASISKTPRAYQSWLNAGSQQGVFDKLFYQCLSVHETSWAAESKTNLDICANNPMQKTDCENVAGELWQWSRDVRAVLAGQAMWVDTFTGRQREAGRQMCQLVPPAFCDQIIQKTLIMTDQIVRPKALCTIN